VVRRAPLSDDEIGRKFIDDSGFGEIGADTADWLVSLSARIFDRPDLSDLADFQDPSAIE